jgi:hypothetical protein
MESKLMYMKAAVITAATVAALTLIGCGPYQRGRVDDPGSENKFCSTPGHTEITLYRQGDTYIYELCQNSSDKCDDVKNPLFLCPNHAQITSVKNDSSSDYSVSHSGMPFVSLKAGATMASFNGMLVEGSWSAQVTGPKTFLPSSVTVSVEWKP